MVVVKRVHLLRPLASLLKATTHRRSLNFPPTRTPTTTLRRSRNLLLCTLSTRPSSLARRLPWSTISSNSNNAKVVASPHPTSVKCSTRNNRRRTSGTCLFSTRVVLRVQDSPRTVSRGNRRVSVAQLEDAVESSRAPTRRCRRLVLVRAEPAGMGVGTTVLGRVTIATTTATTIM